MPFPAPECPSGIVAKVFPCAFKIILELEKISYPRNSGRYGHFRFSPRLSSVGIRILKTYIFRSLSVQPPFWQDVYKRQSHSTRFIRLRLFGGADRLLFCLRFRFLRRLRFLSAACQKRRSQYQCAEKNSGFMHPFSICPEFSHSSLL